MPKIDLENTKTLVEIAISKIKAQYLFDDGNKPWLIGYSGGKDSSCTSQLVYRALSELRAEGKQLQRRVLIFSSDTMIENPIIKEVIQENIGLINAKAREENLPIKAAIVRPDIGKTFWVNVIGQGYPTPNSTFRWCTDRLKIDPANSFIKDYIDKNGEVIIVLGVRKGESQTRDRSLEARHIEGQELRRHTTLANAYVFAPIIGFSTLDVFTYLKYFESPWGSSNKNLHFIYEEADGGDCQMFLAESDVTSNNSCGNTRMGCWVCTVVTKDKSLSGFLATGFYDYLNPLLAYRNWLASIRDDGTRRLHHHINGSAYWVTMRSKLRKDGMYVLSIPKKGDRKQVIILVDEKGQIVNNEDGYVIVDEDQLSSYMESHHLSLNSSDMERIILKRDDGVTYARLGFGPFNFETRKEMLSRLLETEAVYQKESQTKTELISSAELAQIYKIWKKEGLDAGEVNVILVKNHRQPIELLDDDFDFMSNDNMMAFGNLSSSRGIDSQVTRRLLSIEKDYAGMSDRNEAEAAIVRLFNSDALNKEVSK